MQAQTVRLKIRVKGFNGSRVNFNPVFLSNSKLKPSIFSWMAIHDITRKGYTTCDVSRVATGYGSRWAMTPKWR